VPWPYLPMTPRGMGISSSAVLALSDRLGAAFLECVEGKFSGVLRRFTASSSPLAMVLVG
jgi:hypothetical protein